MGIGKKIMQNKHDLISILDKASLWSLYLFIFCLSFSKSIIEITITIAIICFFIKKALKKEAAFEKTSLNTAFLVFILSILPSFFNTYNIFFSLKALVSKNLKYLLLVIIMTDIINDKERMKDLLIISLITGIVTIINAFIQYHVTHIDLLHNYVSFKYVEPWKMDRFIGFPTASFPYPNDFAAWILIFLLPGIASLFMADLRAQTKLLYGFFTAPLFYLLMLTKARAAWLGFFAGLIFLLFFRLKKAVLSFMLILFMIYFAFNIQIAKYTLQLGSVSDRYTMWRNSWAIFKEHPVVGNGINTFFEKYKNVRNDEFKNKRGSYAHNCFLQQAADTGVVGLLGFLYFLFVFFRSTITRTLGLKNEYYRVFNLGLAAGILGFLIHSFFDTNLYSLPLAALFWFAVGLSQAALNIYE